MKNFKKMGTSLALASLSALAFSVTAGTGQLATLQDALTSLCTGIKALIPIVAFLMLVAAGVIYAIGQLLGAETRARASVWATAMLIGAIIAILIVVVTPPLLNALYGGDHITGATC